jgi:hypothetical protein
MAGHARTPPPACKQQWSRASHINAAATGRTATCYQSR